ncbi:MAG: hypothetical protein RBR86_03735 [Pseudobdellovibrionaceae bacterium]|jgi:hypothetical protein|nr:hypothetical protein [Pseudobdellovibrionaceae bacterium]
MGLIGKLKAGFKAFKEAEHIAHQPAADAALDAAKKKPLTDANAVADYLETVKSGGKKTSAHAADDATKAAATAPVPPMYQTGLAGVTGPIVHEISSAIKNFNPSAKKVLGALGLGYVLAIDVPFTEGTDPLIKTGYQNIQKMTNGQWDAEWQKQNADAKQSDQIARSQQGSVNVAQQVGIAFLTGAPQVGVDSAASKFGALIKSQGAALTAEKITEYETTFKGILREQIDQNKDSMLQPAEAKGLASSDSFIKLIEGLPINEQQKAYVASQTLAMTGYK